MSSRHQIIDRQSFEAFRHPAFVQAVNRAANLKCLEAIKSGKLRVVAPQSNSSSPSEYTPRMDFLDDPAESTHTAVFEIPGVKTNDITLNIIDGHIVVSGERRPSYNITQQSEATSQGRAENATQEPKLFIPIQELRFGSFRRAVRIPEGLKESEVKASLNEGMLTVSWPRIPAAAALTRRAPSSSPPTAGPRVKMVFFRYLLSPPPLLRHRLGVPRSPSRNFPGTSRPASPRRTRTAGSITSAFSSLPLHLKWHEAKNDRENAA